MRNLLTIFFAILSCIAFAQNKPLTGIWELSKTKNYQGDKLDVPPLFYKIFSSDGTFSNMRITPEGAVLSHEGSFKLEGTNTYTETVKKQIAGSSMDEKQTSLNYKFSEDGKTLTIEGVLTLDDGVQTYNLYEEWKKVEVNN